MSNYLTTDAELQSVANAIRTKGSTSASLTYPSGFVSAIQAIPSGGGIDTIIMTGELANINKDGRFDSLFTQFPNSFIFQYIENFDYGFYGSQLTTIPFTIPYNDGSSSFRWAFSNMYNLTSLSFLNINANSKLCKMNGMFQNCYQITDATVLNNITGDNNMSSLNWANSLFAHCHKLTTLPQSFISNCFNYGSYNAELTNGGFAYCYSLKAINNLYVQNRKTLSTNAMGFVGLCSISSFTFKDISSSTHPTWSNQLLDLSYCSNGGGAMGCFYYNNGGYYDSDPYKWALDNLPSSKRVTDATSYQALKNDPDYWTSDIAYSHYNHTSAVETINSLPLIIGGGINNIHFCGASGSGTDGGAISNLTASEIAVATNKGWTVSIR